VEKHAVRNSKSRNGCIALKDHVLYGSGCQVNPNQFFEANAEATYDQNAELLAIER
jgi:hypothetical protein